jgi:hypothetical protein
VRNFLLAAVFDDGAGHTSQTEIRVHLHDSVEEIWLTPSTLSIHQGADECRFTVLARFDDQSVGDITDWPGLSFQSSDESVVKVIGDGRLQATAPSGSAQVTVTLILPSPPTDNTSDPATVRAMPGWAQVAAATRVDFVAGPVVPNRADPDSAKRDSVKSVVEGARNVLFIADGFQDGQRFDYRNIVNTIARVLRGEEAAFAAAFQPLNLLKDAINFWTVFLPSPQDGITALGEYFVGPGSRPAGAAFLPQPRPAPDAEEWDYLELIHEVGLPIRSDRTRTLADLVPDWRRLFGPHVTDGRIAATFRDDWKFLVNHTPLNERDTAFGMALAHRPRAAVTSADLVHVLLSPRRTSRASLAEFIGNLSIGGFPIGARWRDGGADAGMVCLVCLSDHLGGVDSRPERIFAVTTGLASPGPVTLKLASGPGLDLETGPVRTTRRHLLASTVAHEFGHVMGLGDEYGDGAGSSLPDGSATKPVDPNLQARVVIAPPTPGPDPPPFDTTKIKWLWPRIASAGVLAAPLDASSISATDIRVPLRKGHSRRFATDDVVRFRQSPDLLPAAMDLFVNLLFRVTTVEDDAVRVVPVKATDGSNATTDIPMGSFDSHVLLIRFQTTGSYCLIRPRRVAGKEDKLVAEPILDQIRTSRGPLDAPKGSVGAACVAALDDGSGTTPTNLPDLARAPRPRADIVGLYEGGGYHDCGVFRPAGRCRMRFSDTITTPFCHVCRFILVEMLDPTKHGPLDRLYPEVGT